MRTRPSAAHDRARFRARWRALRRGARHDDSGAVMAIVLVLIAVLASLTPVLVSQIDNNAGLLVSATEQHAAIEAADAGVQWYENHLNTDPAYYDNTSGGSVVAGDPAMGSGNWCTAGASGCGLPASNPQEAFHYTPDFSSLYATSGASAGALMLEVTGRAGVAGNYSYATVLASFRRSSILANVYFSNYELLDPSVTQSYANDRSAGDQGLTDYDVTVNGTSESVLSATVDDNGTSVSLWKAMCDYYTYEPNTYLDSLGTMATLGNLPPGISGAPEYFSAAYPYYGPYFGSGSLEIESGSEQITVPAGGTACGGAFDFISGETFDGPVYTEDQLHVCGSPAFEGEPTSLTSGAPTDLNYAYKAPGATAVQVNGTTEYQPSGIVDDLNCGEGATPTYASGNAGPVIGGDEAMPATNEQLSTLAEDSGGCLYTGPTLIELVTTSGHTTMDVWSPLSTTSATSSACGTFSAANPLDTGIALPSNGVVYVTGSEATNGVSVPDCVDANAPSASGNDGPYNPSDSNNPGDFDPGDGNCTEGIAFVEGELAGQLTIGAADNIIVTRDITYSCADSASGGSASLANPASVAACTEGSAPDVLGLDAGNDVIVARPDLASNPTYCSYDGTGSPGASVLADGFPNCEMKNPIIDAAIVATQGSFGDQSYDSGAGSSEGGLHLSGTDVSDYRGPFGTFSGSTLDTGYDKEFSFDDRLAYLTPPGLLGLTNADWHEVTTTMCGDEDSENSTSESCPGV